MLNRISQMFASQIVSRQIRRQFKPIKREDAPGEYDIVITWVNRNDEDWHKKYALFERETTDRERSFNLASRYTDFNCLKYLLRSIEKYAIGYRKIFIVTTNQLPNYVRVDHEKLVVIHHNEIFPDPAVLPTFNSLAIETCLHRIPGLHEHFVYFNDDMFLTKRVNAHFFFPGGVPRFFMDKMMSGSLVDENNSQQVAVNNAFKLLNQDFTTEVRNFFDHRPYCFLKSVLFELEDRYSVQFSATRKSRFRSENNIGVTCSLAQYVHIYKQLGVVTAPRWVKFLDYKSTHGLWHLLFKCLWFLKFRGFAICVYDDNTWTKEDYRRLEAFLEQEFPAVVSAAV